MYIYIYWVVHTYIDILYVLYIYSYMCLYLQNIYTYIHIYIFIFAEHRYIYSYLLKTYLLNIHLLIVMLYIHIVLRTYIQLEQSTEQSNRQYTIRNVSLFPYKYDNNERRPHLVPGPNLVNHSQAQHYSAAPSHLSGPPGSSYIY